MMAILAAGVTKSVAARRSNKTELENQTMLPQQSRNPWVCKALA